jgi:hypothetical protein
LLLGLLGMLDLLLGMLQSLPRRSPLRLLRRLLQRLLRLLQCFLSSPQRILRLLGLLRLLLPLHPRTFDQPQRPGIPLTHSLSL